MKWSSKIYQRSKKILQKDNLWGKFVRIRFVRIWVVRIWVVRIWVYEIEETIWKIILLKENYEGLAICCLRQLLRGLRFARWNPPAARFARPHHPTLATLATPLQVGSKTAASNGLRVRILSRGLGGRIEVAASRVKLRSRPRTTSEVGLRSRPRTTSEVALDLNHYLKKCFLLWFFDTPNSKSASGLGGRGGQRRMT